MTKIGEVLFILKITSTMTAIVSPYQLKPQTKERIGKFNKDMELVNGIQGSEFIQSLTRNIFGLAKHGAEKTPRKSLSESKISDHRFMEINQDLQGVNEKTQENDQVIKRLKRHIQTAGTFPAPTPPNVEHIINELFKERHEALWKHTMDITLNNTHIEEMNKSETYNQFNIFYKQYKTSLENWLKEYLANDLKFKILDEQRALMTSREFVTFKNQMDLCVETCRATLWKMLHEVYGYIDINVKHYVELFQDRYESDEIIDYEQMVEFVKKLGTLVQKQISYR